MGCCPGLGWVELWKWQRSSSGAGTVVGMAAAMGQSCRAVVTEGKRDKRELESVKHKELGPKGGSEGCQSLAESLSDNLWQLQGSSWSSGSVLLAGFGKTRALQCFGALKPHWFPSCRPKAEWGDSLVLNPYWKWIKTGNQLALKSNLMLWILQKHQRLSLSSTSTSCPHPSLAKAECHWPWSHGVRIPQGIGYTKAAGIYECLLFSLLPHCPYCYLGSWYTQTPSEWKRNRGCQRNKLVGKFLRIIFISKFPVVSLLAEKTDETKIVKCSFFGR